MESVIVWKEVFKISNVTIKYVLSSAKDNVATALTDLEKGETICLEEGQIFQIEEPIPYMHKFSVKNISKGEIVIKLGDIIGVAISNITRGCHVHIHNIKGIRCNQ